jgi:hypothetical protein
MASPALIVNDVILHVNSLFGLNIPTLPLVGWPPVVRKLWNMFVPDVPPEPTGSPWLWEIPIEGSLDAFPPGATLELTNLSILIEQKSNLT